MNYNVLPKGLELLLFAGRTGSPLEELTHLGDVIQSCSEEPFKVNHIVISLGFFRGKLCCKTGPSRSTGR